MELTEKLERLPDRPGVYLYKDAKGQVVYVGKAASVRSRVRSYFQASRARDAKTDALVDHIADVDYIVTANELEALILESNLVKRHRPRYNIILRDDKHYPFLKLTTNEEFPRLLVARRVQKDGATYYGPFYPATALRETLRLVRALLPLRTCSIKIDGTAERPCLQYYIHRCNAPCTGNGDARGLRADGRGRRGLPRGPRRGPGPPADDGDGGGRRAGEVRAGRHPARPGPGAEHGPRAPEDHLGRAGGPGHPRPGPAGLRGVRPGLLRAAGPAARPRGLLPGQARQRDRRGDPLGAAPPVLLEERHAAPRDPPVDRGPRGRRSSASGWRSCATAGSSSRSPSAGASASWSRWRRRTRRSRSRPISCPARAVARSSPRSSGASSGSRSRPTGSRASTSRTSRGRRRSARWSSGRPAP